MSENLKDLPLSACYIKRAHTMLEQTRLTSLGQARWGEEEGPLRVCDVLEKQACKMKCNSIPLCMPDFACPCTVCWQRSRVGMVMSVKNTISWIVDDIGEVWAPISTAAIS